MILSHQSRSLTAVSNATATTTEPSFSVSYVDTIDTGAVHPGDSVGALTGATAVSIVSAPPYGAIAREITSAVIVNRDTVSHTITVSKVNNGTAYTVFKETLGVNDFAAYDGAKWSVYSAVNSPSFSAPGAIGATTPSSGAFTTLSASGQITSTVASGAVPLSVLSTTQVANLNVSMLGGMTFASPGAIGGTTPAAASFTEVTATTGVTLPKTTTTGIKVDTDSPTWGWRDITSEIDARGSGSNDPNFASYTGTNFYLHQFSATTMQQVYITFHVPHDYVPGTDIYMHVHWSNAAVTPNTGNVVWGFEYSYSKGHNQNAFSAATTVTVTQACPATRYYHNIAETAAITISGLEVDGIIMVRLYRDAAAGGDTCTDAVFVHTSDIHYQSTNMATKGKAPSFYA